MDLDISAITSRPEFRSAALNTANIWTIQDGRCAVGAVMLIRRERQVALITKAERPGYAFSKLLAMPGGLVRGDSSVTFDVAFRRFLVERVERESGIDIAALRDVKLLRSGVLPVSGNAIHERKRHTIIIAVEAHSDAAAELDCNDDSVINAAWYDCPPPWERMAPANCVILATALANTLSEDDQLNAGIHVDVAHKQCCEWAREVDVAEIRHPFEG